MMRGPLDRWLTVPGGALGLSLVLGLAVVVGLTARAQVRLAPPIALSPETRAEVLLRLRGALEHRPIPATALPELRLEHGGPLIVSLYSAGVPVARVEGEGETLATAVAAASAALGQAVVAAELTPERISVSRIEVHLVGARAPYLRWPEVAAVYGLVPGLDGLEVTWGGRTERLTATELNLADCYTAAKPFPFSRFFKTARDGVNATKLDRLVRERFGLASWPDDSRRMRRFRAETFVEGPAREPLEIARGLGSVRLTRAALLDAARAGGAYLARQLGEDGRFRYQVDVSTTDGTSARIERAGYSLPRHAGAAYFLARVLEVTRDESLRPIVERSLDFITGMAEEGGCRGKTPEGRPYTCVSDAGELEANLGGTAMPVVAMLAERRTTGDHRRDELERGLLEWLLLMQKPDGSFADRFFVEGGRPIADKKKLRYFSGESALALAMGYAAFGDERYLHAVERGLDAQLAFYDYFAGRYFIETEHWTCLAAEAISPALKHERYRAFCERYARTLRLGQLEAGSPEAQPDLDGAYLFAPFFVPRANPVATSTEAMVAAYRLSVAHGRPDERIRAQVLGAAGHLLRLQVGPQMDYWVRMPGATGGVLTSAIDPTVRIDTVQHAGSALLGAMELMP